MSRQDLRNLRPKTILIGAGSTLLFAFIVAVVVSSIMAVGASNSYKKNYKTWTDTNQQSLLVSTAKLPPALYSLKNETSNSELSRQKESCTEISTIERQARSASESLPVIAALPLAFLNAEYGKAKETSDIRKKTANEYLVATVDTYSQIRKDCQWNSNVNKAGSNSTLRQVYENWFGDDTCGQTSISKNGSCESFRQIADPQIKAYDEYIALQKTGQNAKIEKSITLLQKANKTFDAGFIQLFKQIYPEYKIPNELQSNPTTDSFLHAVALNRIEALTAQRQSFANL